MNNNPNNMYNSKPSLLMRLIRFAVAALILSLALILLVWIGWIVFPWVTIPTIVEPRVRELGRMAGWGSEIISAVTVIAVVVSVFFFRMMSTRNRRRRWTAISALAGLAVAYFSLHAWLSRDHLYDPTGKPTFYWGLTPQGTIHKQSEPGLNPYTQKPLLPASSEYLTLIRTRLREPLKQVDPAAHEWFDANTGWPMLWYYRSPQGQSEFYARPAIHPLYQVELQPVTVELRRQWEQEQAELKAKATALARQEDEQRQAEAVQRAAEQQRLLEIERARVEAERLKAEAAREEKAARAEEQKIREQALQAERESQEKAAAETRRRQMILDRRVREAATPVTDLEWLSPVGMLAQICPNLRADSFRQEMFEEDFAGRRFRYNGRVIRLLDNKRLALLETVTAGEIHLMIQVNLQPETGDTLRVNREASLAGTVTAIRFISGVTNINGILGQVCILQLGNTTGSYRETVAQAPAKKTMQNTSKGEPLFVPMSSFRENPPLQGAIGFTFENGVRLIFAPLRLLGGHDETTEYKATPGVMQTYPVSSPTFVPYHPCPPSTYRVTYYSTPVARPPIRVIRPIYVPCPPMIRSPTVYSARQHRQ